MNFDKSIRDIIKGRRAENKKPKPFDTIAEVLRIEGDIAWVHIPGGVDETPVRLTVSAKAGDTVQIRVSDGKAFITGNHSAPPTDDTKALMAKVKAEIANEKAKSADIKAEDASGKANVANEKADIATEQVAEVSEAVDSKADSVDVDDLEEALNDSVEDINTQIDILENGISQELVAQGYAVITSEPSLELGKSDSNWKVKITDSEISLLNVYSGATARFIPYEQGTLMRADVARMQTIMFKSSQGDGKLGVEARSNKHISIKEVTQ